jgi:hypothetical protein
MSDNPQIEPAKTCRNCKHWGTHGYEMQYPDARHCDEIGGSGGVRGNGARVAGIDEEGIETDSEFGCIHFTPKK